MMSKVDYIFWFAVLTFVAPLVNPRPRNSRQPGKLFYFIIIFFYASNMPYYDLNVKTFVLAVLSNSNIAVVRVCQFFVAQRATSQTFVQNFL